MAAAALMEMEDLVEEFLLRLPPVDPASLVRAALVCKLWRRVVADGGFRRRFRDFHRRPRLLGVFHGGHCFAPTSSHFHFQRRNAGDDPCVWPVSVLDCRHGLVLLDLDGFSRTLTDMAVWDPITGEQRKLPWPRLPENHDVSMLGSLGWNAAVLCECASSSWNSSCDHDHVDCHFLVVFVRSTRDHGLLVHVYSSEAGSWTLTASAVQNPIHPFRFLSAVYERGTLAESALHFMVLVDTKMRICKYDLAGTPEISWIELPPSCSHCRGDRLTLTSTQYGRLGCARLLENSRLLLWSWEVGGSNSNGLSGWEQIRVVELETMLPSNTRLASLAAFVHGVGIFLFRTDDDLLSIDLECNQVTKVCEDKYINKVVPYVSSCIPALVRPLLGGTKCRCISIMKNSSSFRWRNEVSRDDHRRCVVL